MVELDASQLDRAKLLGDLSAVLLFENVEHALRISRLLRHDEIPFARALNFKFLNGLKCVVKGLGAPGLDHRLQADTQVFGDYGRSARDQGL